MDFEIVKNIIDSTRCEVVNVEQRSEDWLLMRKGRITMSALASFLIFAKTEEAKIKAARIIAGLDKPIFTKEALDRMKIGTDYEDDVRKYYCDKIGKRVYSVGFCVFRENPIFGGSPDGILEDGSILEIKITNKPTPTLSKPDFSEIPLWYYWQCQGNMFVTNASCCHFVSFSRLDGLLYTRIIPYNHDRWINEVYIPAMIFYRDYVMQFLKKIPEIPLNDTNRHINTNSCEITQKTIEYSNRIGGVNDTCNSSETTETTEIRNG